MYPRSLAIVSMLAWCMMAEDASAHFLVLLPADELLSAADGRTAQLQISFTHPMEQGPAMPMAAPRRFGVVAAGKQHDLTPVLEPTKLPGANGYRASVPLQRPGDYVFYLEPAPYWEAAEEKLIVHYTKVVVAFMGAEQGWDTMVGLPVEIEPLVRPYGLWTGNSFRGVVRYRGKPVPFATVEVEYFNEDRAVAIPDDAFVTQVIKTNAQGEFCYTMPKAGWWGFAALVDGEPMNGPDGKPHDVELGGLMWVRTVDMK